MIVDHKLFRSSWGWRHRSNFDGATSFLCVVISMMLCLVDVSRTYNSCIINEACFMESTSDSHLVIVKHACRRVQFVILFENCKSTYSTHICQCWIRTPPICLWCILLVNDGGICPGQVLAGLIAQCEWCENMVLLDIIIGISKLHGQISCRCCNCNIGYSHAPVCVVENGQIKSRAQRFEVGIDYCRNVIRSWLQFLSTFLITFWS